MKYPPRHAVANCRAGGGCAQAIPYRIAERLAQIAAGLLISLVPVHGSDAIVAYPLPHSAATSADFHVTANDTDVPVQHYRDRHVAQLSAKGEIVIKIKANNPITSYSIHPSSFGLKGTVTGDTLEVSLAPTLFNPQPAYLLFKINKLENLVVLVDPPEENAPLPHDPGVQDVSAPPYLADPSGKLLATIAIQSAIDKASQSGGGIVYVPLGLYRVQGLMLKSRVTLYLAGGAVIQGSDRLADYAGDATYQHSASKNSRPPVVKAEDFKNVAIRGRGWIDAADEKIYTTDGVLQEVEPRGLYHRVAIQAVTGTGFTLDGIRAQDGAGWSLLLNRVENIQITRFKIIGPMWRGNDGIDICGCNAMVDKCFVYTGDDDFCSKALLVNYPVHDIHFRNSIGFTKAGGVKAGMQVRSPQSEIYFENIDIIHAGRGLVVQHNGETNKNDHGDKPIQNIFFTDIRVEEVNEPRGETRNPIEIIGKLPGRINNIFFKRVSVGNFGPQPSRIIGFDANNPVTNVVFDNLTIGGKPIDSISAGDFKIQNAADIKFLRSAP